MAQCTAKSKRSQQQCTRHAMIGQTKCYMHGGKTLVGVAAPTFKTGRYSKYLPAHMVPQYEQTLADTKRLELDDEIAVMRARALDLIGRVDTGESGHLWKALRGAYADLQAATTPEDLRVAITAIGQLIMRGAADYAAWEDAGRTIDRTARLIESQRKREQELEHNMPLEQLTQILTVFMGAVVKYVSDRETRAAIQAEFNRALYLPHQPEPAA